MAGHYAAVSLPSAAPRAPRDALRTRRRCMPPKAGATGGLPNPTSEECRKSPAFTAPELVVALTYAEKCCKQVRAHPAGVKEAPSPVTHGLPACRALIVDVQAHRARQAPALQRPGRAPLPLELSAALRSAETLPEAALHTPRRDCAEQIDAGRRSKPETMRVATREGATYGQAQTVLADAPVSCRVASTLSSRVALVSRSQSTFVVRPSRRCHAAACSESWTHEPKRSRSVAAMLSRLHGFVVTAVAMYVPGCSASRPASSSKGLLAACRLRTLSRGGHLRLGMLDRLAKQLRATLQVVVCTDEVACSFSPPQTHAE